MGSHLSEFKAKNTTETKDLLPAASKWSTEVIFEPVPSLRKGSVELLFREPVHIHIGKLLRDGHIPEHAQLTGCIFEHAQFKW